MSEFLSESGPSGVQLGSTSPVDLEMSARERALARKFWRGTLQVPEDVNDFLQWLKLRLVIDGFELPISQVLGFSQFTAQAATRIATNDSTSSVTYVGGGTPGPTLTGLSPGRYVVQFGAFARTTNNAHAARMSVEITGQGTSDSNSAAWTTTDGVAGGASFVATLTEPNSSLTGKYRIDNAASTAFFAERWLIALRFANL